MNRRELLVLFAALAACGGRVDVPAEPGVVADPTSTFHAIYDDPALRARFEDFLANVFHLYPTERFHDLIAQATDAKATDAEIYALIATKLPEVTPVASTVTHALPALIKQKNVMAGQMAELLGDARVDGYLEVGTLGRYVNPLRKRVPVEGDVFVLHTEAPSKDPVSVLERGQLAPIGTHVPMGDYDPVASTVPDGAVDVVSNLIGFHHAPEGRLDGFLGGLRRILRPGGRLILREHDVVDPTMWSMVALAHDVFNVGTEQPWPTNEGEIRRFRSVADWVAFLGEHGFTQEGPAKGLRQDGDPTDNALLVFRRA